MIIGSQDIKLTQAILKKWQDVLNLVSASFEFPYVFIVQTSDLDSEIVVGSKLFKEEYKQSVMAQLAKAFSSRIYSTKHMLEFENHYLESVEEVSFLAYPIKYPDESWFGVLCLLDKENRVVDKSIRNFLQEFKIVVEKDISDCCKEKINKESFNKKVEELKLALEEFYATKNIDCEYPKEKIGEYGNSYDELVQRERKYKTFFAETNSAIVVFEGITDSDGDLIDLNYKEMNAANERLIGIPRDRVMGKTLLELFPNTEPGWIKHFNSVVKHRKKESYYAYYSDLKKYIYVDSFPLGDNEFVVSAFDLTEKVKLQEKLQEVENSYRTIFYKNPSVMMILSPEDGKIKDVNDAASRFYGYSREEFIQQNISDINIEGELVVRENIEKVRKSPEKLIHAKHKLASGEIREVEIHSGVVIIEGQEYLHSVIIDVTTRNRNLLKITRLSNAVEQSPVAVVITNLDGEIEYVNPRTCLITGYATNELLGQTPRILKSGKQSIELYDCLWQTITSGNKWRGEFFNQRKDGSYYWEAASVAPILNDKKEIIGYIKIAQDISDKKATEYKLKNALIKAEENDRLKTAFLANLSHEVRTPLNGLLGFTNFLISEDLPKEERNEYAAIVKECGSQLMDIMDNILQASLLEAKQLELTIENISVLQLLKGVIQVHSVEAKKKNLDLKLNMQFESDFYLETDKVKLSQVLNNLVQNAIKFTEVGEVCIGCKKVHDTVFFYVEDSGIGISAENQKVIFDRFRQVENHLVRKYGGTGLGLSISKEIVELLGGEIWVVSQEGQGSKFSFTIPVRGEA